ncbi:hypothetical protein CEXT_419121 [Caerostris extrusa]|uniref:Uncharacterized protein n=1 Tax=Caerostris extrusa TaxID=172846 RepID=A0AAV4UU64_CAEEX|nr:hypothetical protein CEXT_419121 [Caerostris extrusa]
MWVSLLDANLGAMQQASQRVNLEWTGAIRHRMVKIYDAGFKVRERTKVYWKIKGTFTSDGLGSMGGEVARAMLEGIPLGAQNVLVHVILSRD